MLRAPGSDAVAITFARLKGPDPVPSHVPDAVRTLRPTCHDKIGTDLPLELLAELTLHRQCALRSDIALKSKSWPLGLGETILNG